MYIYLDLLTRNQVFIYIMSLTLPDILILLDKKKRKKNLSPNSFYYYYCYELIFLVPLRKLDRTNVRTFQFCVLVCLLPFFFFFPAALIQSKNNNTSRNQEIDSRNTVIPYTERMNHTQKETSDRCAFIKV